MQYACLVKDENLNWILLWVVKKNALGNFTFCTYLKWAFYIFSINITMHLNTIWNSINLRLLVVCGFKHSYKTTQFRKKWLLRENHTSFMHNISIKKTMALTYIYCYFYKIQINFRTKCMYESKVLINGFFFLDRFTFISTTLMA